MGTTRPARTAAVLGATGLVGERVTRLLVLDARWSSVMTVGRRRALVEGPTLTQIEADILADGPWLDALAVDDVFCCLGTTIAKAGSQAAFRAVDHGAVVRAAATARRRGASQVLVVSALGADDGSRVFYNRVKGEMEAAVIALAYPACQIFRPSLLLGPRAERRLGERLAAHLSKPIRPLLGKYRPIHRDAVAAAMVRIAATAPAGLHIYASDRIAAIAGVMTP
jgi:uncharacterized protein YbjT (DUF2867 family)